MNGTGHRIASQAAWLAANLLHPGIAIPELIFGGIVASATSSDDYSPDEDQRGIKAKLIPGGHRGLTHMPELVTAAAAALIWYTGQRGYGWFGWGIAAGWLSHLFADFLFGGIPFLILGGKRVGLHLDTGGKAEDVVAWMLGLVCIPLLWLDVGAPGYAAIQEVLHG